MTTLGNTARKAKPLNTSAGTHTREGLEPYLKLKSSDGTLTLEAPVRVWPPLKGEILPRAQTDREGRKLYALPGGEVMAV